MQVSRKRNPYSYPLSDSDGVRLLPDPVSASGPLIAKGCWLRRGGVACSRADDEVQRLAVGPLGAEGKLHVLVFDVVLQPVSQSERTRQWANAIPRDALRFLDAFRHGMVDWDWRGVEPWGTNIHS